MKAKHLGYILCKFQVFKLISFNIIKLNVEAPSWRVPFSTSEGFIPFWQILAPVQIVGFKSFKFQLKAKHLGYVLWKFQVFKLSSFNIIKLNVEALSWRVPSFCSTSYAQSIFLWTFLLIISEFTWKWYSTPSTGNQIK